MNRCHLDTLLLELPYDDLGLALLQFKEQLKLNEDSPAFLQTVFPRLAEVLDKLVIPGLECYVKDNRKDILESSCDVICWFYNTFYSHSRSGGTELISPNLTLALLSSFWTRIPVFPQSQPDGLVLVTSAIQIVLETIPRTSYDDIFNWLKDAELPKHSNAAVDELFFTCVRSFTARVVLDELETLTQRGRRLSGTPKDLLNSVLEMYERWRPADSTERGEYLLDRELSILKKSASSEPATVIHDSACSPVTDPNCYKYFLQQERAKYEQQKDPDWVQIFESCREVHSPKSSASSSSLSTVVFDTSDFQSLREPKSRCNVFRKLFRATKPLFVSRKIDPNPPTSGQLSTFSTMRYRLLDWFWSFWYPVDEHDEKRFLFSHSFSN
ncbi:hypothetical protein KL930_004290 [Ogataea haglerorum]|uniref:Uncharacterized protein n=1 Tax=Ogataea haglerorum TaxID=1937702 RepID=A0AAN6HZ49_9ASCO|nr:hypothetical protein KL915_004398 [Ogataea haglerorum]KAG7693873.1 hypothetical protein KL951_004352 [Ogataea haglerorum]KAG7704268.1 hypothetical protein KL914_004255 [Ogataea haglerorum]KAG7704453.1 hypothetical protein KL950_004260 [Ogataea haglerorum]KAG7715925.1 hypothetical protein KL913_003738 [Ogataea haglerorum]